MVRAFVVRRAREFADGLVGIGRSYRVASAELASTARVVSG